MKKLLLIAVISISIQGFAQISHGGSPFSFTNNLNSTVPVYETPILNIQPYLDEDAIADQHKDIAWRFGIEQLVNLNLNNSGLWETLPNGDRIWRLDIKSPNAKTINLNYNSFYLPVGATFFVYNKNQILGSFTNQNNSATGDFSTSLLKGDNVILEYFEPLAVQGQGTIEVSSVVHGYRDLFNQLKAFGSSGGCNVNAICDTTFWGNEIRSAVILLTSGNSRFCSGALVNNTLQNGTPYILTANHCTPATNNIFMFNYQSPSCSTNIDGPTTQTISGCTLRANDGPSDFFLVELSSIPPANYNVFYAGWSNDTIAPTKGTGIHFPSGDVKKISHDIDPLVESTYYTSPGLNHWRVNDWNSGTTEGGSSGSPLFDQNHRIVGQLHGGDAACSNDAFDLYGKFAYSWQTDPTPSQQLKFWLDPTSSGVTVLNGYDPNGSNFTTDAVLLDISGIETFVCGDSIFPKITIRNHGTTNLNALDVFYEIDGTGFIQINWGGNLPSYAIDEIVVPSIYVASGAHIFKSYCSNPNGTTDNNLLNDSATVNFNSNAQPIFATLNLITDDYGAETSWLIRDFYGNIVLQSTGYSSISGGETISENLCLYDSCFTFVLKDAYGDGYCCSFGSGEFQLLNNWGDTIAENYTFNGDSLTFPFCLGTSTNINELSESSFSIYPNPSTGKINIDFAELSTQKTIHVYDGIGKLIYNRANTSGKNVQIDLGNTPKGLYFISITSEKGTLVKKVLIN